MLSCRHVNQFPSCRGSSLTLVSRFLLSWSRLEVHPSRFLQCRTCPLIFCKSFCILRVSQSLETVHITLDLLSLAYISLWNCLALIFLFLVSVWRHRLCSARPVIYLITVLCSSICCDSQECIGYADINQIKQTILEYLLLLVFSLRFLGKVEIWFRLLT